MPEDSSPNWDRIENFIGFGNPAAPYVFIGMEEGLLSEDNLDADLAARSKYDSYMDLYDAQAELAGTKKYFGARPVEQRTWRPVCDLMLRLDDSVEKPTLAQRLRYQADKLGRCNGKTLLTELMPYPRKSADERSWPYRRYERFDDYKTYREVVLPERVSRLRTLFEMSCERRLVVAYGKKEWPVFKTLFETDWKTAATVEWGRVGGFTVVLAHQLSSRTFNGRAGLDRFADAVGTAVAEAGSR
jgi:hypothetical protein